MPEVLLKIIVLIVVFFTILVAWMCCIETTRKDKNNFRDNLYNLLKKAVESRGYSFDKLDFDGSGMNDDYVMFDVYDTLHKDAQVIWPRGFLAGETLATWKVNGVAKLLNLKGKEEDSPKMLGNYLPYPSSPFSWKTRSNYHSSEFQKPHNAVHKENPFFLIKDIEYGFETDFDKNCSRNSFTEALSNSAEYWKLFKDIKNTKDKKKNFKKYIHAMKLKPFVKSYLYDSFNYDGKNALQWQSSLTTDTAQEYYDEVRKCIFLRTETLLKNKKIIRLLKEYCVPD